MLLGGSYLLAEEILNKQGKRWLGWQTSVIEFKTCDGTAMSTKGASIEATSDKCRDPKKAPPVQFVGKITSVDSEKQLLVMEVDRAYGKGSNQATPTKGDTISVFVSKNVPLEKNEKRLDVFTNLGKGETVYIRVNENRAAESITTDQRMKTLENKT